MQRLRRDLGAMVDGFVLLIVSYTLLLVYAILRTALGFLGFLYVSLRPSKNLKKYGSWALVTGATDGIGLAFATALAQKGLLMAVCACNHNIWH